MTDFSMDFCFQCSEFLGPEDFDGICCKCQGMNQYIEDVECEILDLAEYNEWPGVRYREPQRLFPPAAKLTMGAWVLVKERPCVVCGEPTLRWDTIACDARHSGCKPPPE